MKEITAISNNFGAGVISFRTLQKDSIVIMTGEVSVNTAHPQYLSAQVLEITVPSLSIKKSAVAGLPMLASGQLPRQGTFAKTWVKDRNTICIEKISAFDSYGSFDLLFSTAYVPVGARPPFQTLTDGYMSIISEGDCVMSCSNEALSWTDDYLYIGASLRKFQGNPDGSPWSLPISSIPVYETKLAMLMPVTDSSKPGNPFYILTISGTRLHVNGFPYHEGFVMGGSGFAGFAIRNNEN